MALTAKQQIIAAGLQRAITEGFVWIEGSPAIKAGLDAENVQYREDGDGILAAAQANLVIAKAIDDAVTDTSQVLLTAIYEGERARLSATLAAQAAQFASKETSTTAEKTVVDGVTF